MSNTQGCLGCVQHTHDAWWTRKHYSSLSLRSANEKKTSLLKSQNQSGSEKNKSRMCILRVCIKTYSEIIITNSNSRSIQVKTYCCLAEDRDCDNAKTIIACKPTAGHWQQQIHLQQAQSILNALKKRRCDEQRIQIPTSKINHYIRVIATYSTYLKYNVKSNKVSEHDLKRHCKHQSTVCFVNTMFRALLSLIYNVCHTILFIKVFQLHCSTEHFIVTPPPPHLIP